MLSNSNPPEGVNEHSGVWDYQRLWNVVEIILILKYESWPEERKRIG